MSEALTMTDIEALAEERGIDPAALDEMFQSAALAVLGINGVPAELRTSESGRDPAGLTSVALDDQPRSSEISISEFFEQHGVDPASGIRQFKCLVRGAILGTVEELLCVPEESTIEEMLAHPFWGELLRAGSTPEEVEIVIRIERELARRGLTADQVDQLVRPEELGDE